MYADIVPETPSESRINDIEAVVVRAESMRMECSGGAVAVQVAGTEGTDGGKADGQGGVTGGYANRGLDRERDREQAIVGDERGGIEAMC